MVPSIKKKYPVTASFVMRYKPRRGPYKGWEIEYTYYKARIMINGKSKFLGHFPNAELAHQAYVKAKEKENARSNMGSTA